MNLTRQIESELAKKDLKIGHLMILAMSDYSEVMASLKQISDEGRIVYDWKNSEIYFHLRKNHHGVNQAD